MTKQDKYIALFEHFSESGMSAVDFCRAQGIVYKTFLRWAKKLNFDVRKKGWARGQHPRSRNLMYHNRRSHGVDVFKQSGLVPCTGCLWADECEHYEPGQSCKILADFQAAKIDELMNDTPHIRPADFELVCIAVREMAIQALIMRFTSHRGLFRATSDESIALQPVMSQFWVSVNALARILDKLGLSPMARKQLAYNTTFVVDRGDEISLADILTRARDNLDNNDNEKE
jgi:hypothetical protein